MDASFDGWKYENGLLSIDLVEVGALGTAVLAWFNVEVALADTRLPSDKQRAAWERFCALPASTVTASLTSRLRAAAVHAVDIVASHVVIPHQDRTMLRLVCVHIEIESAEAGRDAYEAVFADEELVYVGEDSGLWTRTEWAEDFNQPEMTAKEWRQL
jgi:hypothetical protein